MKKVLIIIISFLFCHVAKSQRDPVKWTFSSKKIADKTFEVHFIATINLPWHIYAQDNNEDVGLPTSFSFTKNPLLTTDGKIKEVGELVKEKEDDIELKYYGGQVTFVQVVKLKTNVKTSLTGKVEYMACTGGRCLPPAERKFSITVGGQ